jgi:glycerate-2-kinase
MLSVAGLALVFAVGCGGEKTDVSAGTSDFNKELAAEGSTLECPKEVDGGEGTQFECTLKGKGGQAEKVQLKVVKQGGDLAVDTVDQAAFDTARQKVQGQ